MGASAFGLMDGLADGVAGSHPHKMTPAVITIENKIQPGFVFFINSGFGGAGLIITALHIIWVERRRAPMTAILDDGEDGR